VGCDCADLRGVELFVDVGLLADEILSPPDRLGKILAEGKDPEAIGHLVPDPAARRLELREGLPELVDRRLRLEDVPDEQAEDQPITAT
jgi:hypothetical protein